MMTKQDIASQWIEKAGHDLINARHTLTLKDDCPYDTVCFHAQQAVEKCIKALLAYHGVQITRVHDIDALIEQLPKAANPPISVDEQVKLSNYAVIARYPGVHEEPTLADAAEALRIAERIREWTLGQLEK